MRSVVAALASSVIAPRLTTAATTLRRGRSALLALVVAASALACPSYVTIPDDVRARIDEARTGELLYLRQSVYAGMFYDDDRYRLVHPRRFEELTYLQTVEGDPIPPAPADEVIPAGTRVRVERIEWPTGDAVFRRPLFTPRYTPWIFLRVARGRGRDVTVERDQRHILLLPGGLNDGESFDLWFNAVLSADDPNPWLASLPEEQQNGIATKRAVVGMDYDALSAALGYPDRIRRDAVDGKTVEVASWGTVDVTLEGGHVTRIDNAAPLAGASP